MSDEIIELGDPEMEALALYKREVGRITKLSEEEMRELGFRSLHGDLEARSKLVKGNLRLAWDIADKYRGLGVPLEDLIEEANLGLILAVEVFDPEKGKFSTIATPYIRKAITGAITKRSGFGGLTDWYAKLKMKIKEEINSSENFSHDREYDPFDWIDNVISLETAISEDEEGDETTSQDFVDGGQSVMQEVLDGSLTEALNEIIAGLSEKEQLYLNCFFGREGCKEMSPAEIAEAYKESEARVQTTIRHALRALRANEQIRSLRGYLR